MLVQRASQSRQGPGSRSAGRGSNPRSRRTPWCSFADSGWLLVRSAFESILWRAASPKLESTVGRDRADARDAPVDAVTRTRWTSVRYSIVIAKTPCQPPTLARMTPGKSIDLDVSPVALRTVDRWPDFGIPVLLQLDMSLQLELVLTTGGFNRLVMVV